MDRPCVFVAAFPNPDGSYTLFFPANTASPSIVVLHHTKAHVGGQSVDTVQTKADILGVVGALIGAAAGLVGLPVPVFVKQLHVADDAIRAQRFVPEPGEGQH